MKIIGKLKLERFDENYRLLERPRIQPMRSWTRGLLEILYCSHAQILPAAPFVCLGDIENTTRNMVVYGNLTTGYRGMNNHGRIAAPPGFSPVGQLSLAPVNSGLGINSIVQGCDIGIQIGNGSTAVTPTDTRLARRIGHGIRAADGVDATFEAYDVDDDQARDIITDDNTQLSQPFIPQHDFRCSSVELKLYKTLAPAGPLTVEIRVPQNLSATDNWQYPRIVGGVIATGTILSAALGGAPGAFVPCVFGTPVDLYAGHLYFIVCHSAGVNGANFFSWRYDNTIAAGGSPPAYGRAVQYEPNTNVFDYLTRTANLWVNHTIDSPNIFMFRTIGRSIGEMEYGSCEIVHRVTANPNDAFDIKRFFYNRSGAAITVNEVGMATEFLSYSSAAGGTGAKQLINLVARDVVAPGVTVNNNEILLVTYTPAITV